MADALKLVKEKEKVFKALYQRMDDDRDLRRLKKYVMKDRKNKIVSGILNVTLNDPAVFAAYVISALSSTSQQTVVQSDIEDFDTAKIENFQKAALNGANARLRKMGRPELNAFFDEQLAMRGRAAGRCIFREENKVLIPDITPWDTRYVTYHLGPDGLEWAAFKGNRTKDEIMAEWGKELEGKDIKLKEDKNQVLDMWNTKGNELFIGGKLAHEQDHPFGFCPVAIQVVPLGSMFADEDNEAYYGESIYFMIRDIIEELNRLASMAQTANFLALRGPKEYASKEGAGATPPDYEEVTDPESITSVDIGGGTKNIPIQDLLRAFDRMNAILESRMERGSLTSIDLGNLQFPLSGTALVEIGEGRDQVLLPRLRAKALLNQELAEMFTAQVIQIGGSVELGTKGHKQSFNISDLEGEYETSYRYSSKSPTVDAGRYSLAAGVGNLLSEKFKMEKILQVDDPAGENRQKRVEEAERLSPGIKMERTLEALVETDTEQSLFEAEILSAEMGINLETMMAGELQQQPKPEKRDEPTQVLPLNQGPRPAVPAQSAEGADNAAR